MVRKISNKIWKIEIYYLILHSQEIRKQFGIMITVANPIYDSVFKYLMEDERIARTILSALLKREVVEVNVRKHEYSNGARDNISMFRIDFGAQVRQDDGSLKLILIELQKTWLETETLRFRQYLGTQYADPGNIIKDNNPELLNVFIEEINECVQRGEHISTIYSEIEILSRNLSLNMRILEGIPKNIILDIGLSDLPDIYNLLKN